MNRSFPHISKYLFAALLFFIISNDTLVSLAAEVNYKTPENWAYFPTSADYDVDVFFLAPTAFMGNDSTYNMDINNKELRANFLGATNMEKGIYSARANFYAPYYRQIGINVYALRAKQKADTSLILLNYTNLAYSDIEAAFDYYLSRSNRAFVLAGFSQGSEMLLRLLKNRFKNIELQKRLIAAYLIGWSVTDKDLSEAPHLKMATSANDFGCIVSFCSESPTLNQSLIVPNKTHGINPLNWRTDTTKADKSLNMGAVFTDYQGKAVKELPQLTGAYICPIRGTLKVTDVNPKDYPPGLSIFEPGNYHIYDYQFFFNNLKQNVIDRIKTYNHAYMRKKTVNGFMR